MHAFNFCHLTTRRKLKVWTFLTWKKSCAKISRSTVHWNLCIAVAMEGSWFMVTMQLRPQLWNLSTVVAIEPTFVWFIIDRWLLIQVTMYIIIQLGPAIIKKGTFDSDTLLTGSTVPQYVVKKTKMVWSLHVKTHWTWFLKISRYFLSASCW